LDAISITDHTHYNPIKADVTTDLTRPYAIASPTAIAMGIILIPGVEFAEKDLHANALFIKDPNALRGLSLAESYREAHNQGAFVFWNHPGWKGKAEWWEPIANAHAAGHFQGIEVANSFDYYPESFAWVGEKNLAPLANSDVHTPISISYSRRQRPVTLVFAKTADIEGIREALFARRCAAWMGGQIWGPEEMLKGLWLGGVRVLTPAIRSRSAGFMLHNLSAFPFRLRVVKSPPWLQVRATDLVEEQITGLRVEIAKDAPAGPRTADVELEITNLHPAPDRNLQVTVPLKVDLK
jgi:hypothetical protein